MFMSAAITGHARECESDFVLMHLNALNGSTSGISESRYGPSSYVYDEPASVSSRDNLALPSQRKLASKETLKVPSSSRLRPMSPHPTSSRSKEKSPYLLRRKGNKYEAEIPTAWGESSERSLSKDNCSDGTIDRKEHDIVPGQAMKVKVKQRSSHLDVSRSLDFDSISQKNTLRREYKKSTSMPPM